MTPNPEPLEMARTFAAELRQDLGDRITSAVLFGSGARGEWIQNVSDVNVLVLVRDVGAVLLADASATCARWVQRGVLPLVMAGEEWRRAHDVFGIELEDIRDAHVALHGPDPAAELRVDPLMLRLQAEREIRSKLLHLHGSLLLTAAQPLRTGELLRHSLPAFTTYLRVVLRLEKQPVPASTPEVIRQACARAGLPADPFLAVLAQRPNTGWSVDIRDPIVDDYNAAAERLAAFIDAHDAHTS